MEIQQAIESVEAERLLSEALERYGLDAQTLGVQRELARNWHGDRHFQIRLEGVSYSARFLSYRRYPGHNAYFELTDEILAVQMDFCDFLVQNDLPFMRRKPPGNGEPFVRVEVNGETYRFVLFEWMEGVHCDVANENMVAQMGKIARRLHDVSTRFHAPNLPRTIHTDGKREYLQILRTQLAATPLSPPDARRLHEYLLLAEQHVQRATATEPPRPNAVVIAFDLNYLNILWDERFENICGVIDFEHFFYTERAQELPWFVKWYSRTVGVDSHEMSPALAQTFLQSYGADDILSAADWARIPSLTWLSGCLNWNFVAKTLDILKGYQEAKADGPARLGNHLDNYLARGEKLIGLVAKRL